MFCSYRSYNDVHRVYNYLYKSIKDVFWAQDTLAPGTIGSAIIEQYTGNAPASMVDELPAQFAKRQSNCRAVVATSAFGLGLQVIINSLCHLSLITTLHYFFNHCNILFTLRYSMLHQIEGVERIVHWGPAPTLAQYWQEVGRAGRTSGDSGHAILLHPKGHFPCDEEMRNYDHQCLRRAILSTFYLDGSSKTVDDVCGGESCCSICKNKPQYVFNYLYNTLHSH